VLVQTTVSQRPAGEVLSTSPAGGTETDKGATVTVRVSDGDRIKMPDLVGQTVSQALATMRGVGWSGSASDLQQTQERTLDPDRVGKVMTQAQPPGSDVGRDGVVTVGVGTLGIPG
jgi:eukaryotic-like serine/threonine-protein kinase